MRRSNQRNIEKPDAERKVVMPCSKCRMDDFFIERDLGPDIPMMSTGKISGQLRDGKSMTSSPSGRKSNRKMILYKCMKESNYDQEVDSR